LVFLFINQASYLEPVKILHEDTTKRGKNEKMKNEKVLHPLREGKALKFAEFHFRRCHMVLYP